MRTRHARPLAAAALLTALAACADDARTPLAPAAADTPSLSRSGGDATAAQGGTQGGTQRGRKIPDQYVVVLREGASVEETTRRNTIAAQRTFSRALNGFSAKLTRGQVQQLEKDADVLYIAQDEEVQLAQALAEPSVIQASATWGIDRTDQVSRALSGTYGYTATGSGVRVYIVDTGIRTTHAEFDGVATNRALDGYDFVNNDALSEDCNGHGTHVAGTVGGTAYGIAKGATLVGVRVFGCSGGASYSTIIAGLDWVINDNLRRGGRAVVNMSLGGGAFQAMDDATNNLAAYNIVPVVAAGNSNVDACTTSPARAPLAVTVGATDIGDNRASFSNFGPCLDLFAPGQSITSAWWQSDAQTATISGTSMAAPHVAGMAALILQMAPTASAGLVAEMLRDAALEGYVLNAGAGSPNRLLHKPTGRLSGTGAEQVQPWGSYYFATATGNHIAYARATSGSTLALYLDRWNGASWVQVAANTAAGSSKVINYTNTVPSAYFRWRVANPSTTVLTTDYDLVLRRP